jgi:hypothetical protein
MFLDLLKRYGKWMVSRPLRAGLGMFLGAFILFMFWEFVCSPALRLITNRDYPQPDYYTSFFLGLVILIPMSILFSVFVWYYNRSKKGHSR